MKSKTFRNLGLGLALAAALTTTSQAAMIKFNWVLGGTSQALADELSGFTLVNANVTSSGSLMYNTATMTVSDYTFNVKTAAGKAGKGLSANVKDRTLMPASPVGSILGDNDLELGNIPMPPKFSTVVSMNSGGIWLDYSTLGAGNENLFDLSGKVVTGDWVPMKVPEQASPVTLLFSALFLMLLGWHARKQPRILA
jgi:hypothetical protein